MRANRIVCSYCGKPVTPDTAHARYGNDHHDCVEAEQNRLIAAFAKRHPFDTQTQPGRPYHWGPADIRTLDRNSPEGRDELRRRAERKAREREPVVDGDLARLVGAT